jgi:hypothetical protein
MVADPNYGKNWQKILHDLQTNKHIFMHLNPETDYGKLNDAYKSIKKTLEVGTPKLPPVSSRFTCLTKVV